MFSFCLLPASFVTTVHMLHFPRNEVGVLVTSVAAFAKAPEPPGWREKISPLISYSLAFPRQITHLHCEQRTHDSVVVSLIWGLGKIGMYFIHQIIRFQVVHLFVFSSAESLFSTALPCLHLECAFPI